MKLVNADLHPHPGEKLEHPRDDRIQDLPENENDDEHEDGRIALERHTETAILIGQDREKDLGTIERRQWDEIENGQDDIDDDNG